MTKLLLIIVLGLPAPAGACGLAILFAIDVSLSVDQNEYKLQVDGIAGALRDERVSQTLTGVPGGVALSVMQWSGRNEQHVRPSWTMIESASDISDFGDFVSLTPRHFQSKTATGSSLHKALVAHDQNPFACATKITNVSGDGIANDGPSTQKLRDLHSLRGHTINGLIILGEDDRLHDFYKHNVVGGPGHFLEVAHGYHDYERAMIQKLLKEVPPQVARIER